MLPGSGQGGRGGRGRFSFGSATDGEDAAPAAGRGRGKGAGASGAEGAGAAGQAGGREKFEKLCLACPDSAKGTNSCWCPKHKRAQQNIYNHAFTKKGKGRGQDQLYKRIFGSRTEAMNVPQACSAVVDYVNQYGDGGDGKHSGQTRGGLDLNQYQETTGWRQAQKSQDAGGVWTDKESFIISMKNLRAWTAEQSLNEWNDIKKKADEDSQDHQGYKGAERLRVPSSLYSGLGLGRDFEEKEKYEDHAITASTKAAKFNIKDRESFEARAGKGFAVATGPPSGFKGMSAASGSPGPSSATASPADFLSGLAKQMGLAGGGENPQGAPDSPADKAPGDNEPGPAIPAASLASVRNRGLAKAEKDVKAIAPAMKADLVAACNALRQWGSEKTVFAQSLLEVMQHGALFLGLEIKASMYTTAPGGRYQELAVADFAATEINWFERARAFLAALPADAPEEEKAAWTAPQGIPDDPPQGESAHHLELRRILCERISDLEFLRAEKRLQDLPVEQPQAMRSLLGLARAAYDFGIKRSAAELEDHKVYFEQQMEYYKSMKKAVRTATRDLRSHIRGRQKEEQQKETERQKQEQEAERKRKLEEKEADEKKVAKVHAGAVFSLDFSGHPSIISVQEGAMSDGSITGAEPFILVGAEDGAAVGHTHTQILKAEERSVIMQALVAWQEAFPTEKMYLKDDKISADVEDCHGKEGARGLFDHCLGPSGPLDSLDAAEWPSLRRLAEGMSFFAYGPSLVWYGMEPSAMGVLRFVCGGALKVIMASPTSLLKLNPDQSAMHLVGALRHMNAEKLAAAKTSGAKIYHGLIKAGSCMFTPMGWIVGYTAVNNEAVHGVRRAVIPVTAKQADSVQAELGALADAMGKNASDDLPELKAQVDVIQRLQSFLLLKQRRPAAAEEAPPAEEREVAPAEVPPPAENAKEVRTVPPAEPAAAAAAAVDPENPGGQSDGGEDS